MGRRGLYYRKTLASPSPIPRGSTPSQAVPDFVPSSELQLEVPNVTLLDLECGDSSDLVESLNDAARRFALSPLAWMTGKHRVPVMYDLTDAPAQTYADLLEAFDGIRQTQGRWLIDAAGVLTTLYQRKTNAGASSVVARSPTAASVAGPKWLATNIPVPSLTTSGIAVFLLPDQLLVQTGKRFAGSNYAEIATSVELSQFVEAGPTPQDARQTGHTWKFVNKNGGPDRRFNDNQVLPILEYAEVVVSGEGLRLRWQFSNVAHAQRFAQALTNIASARPDQHNHRSTEAPIGGQAPPSGANTPDRTATESSAIAADWYPDPSGKFELRYWNGGQWTHHVFTAGQQLVDSA